MMELLALGNPLNHVVQHDLVVVPTPLGPFTILSNHVLMLLLGGVLLAVVLPRAVRRRETEDELERLTPRGFFNFLESICSYLRTEVAEPALGPYTDRFIKYVWRVFHATTRYS